MGRKATGTKPGRKTDFSPAHIEFLTSYGSRFERGSGNTTLYSEVCNALIEKFGYSCLNPSNKHGIAAADLQLDKDIDMLPVPEQNKIRELRQSAMQAIRAKISNWLRHYYNHRKDDRDGVNKTELAMYSELYYESKLKTKFDEIWNGCLQSGILPNHRVHWMKKYTTEYYLKELVELRDEIRRKCDAKYAEELQAWKGRAEWSASPEAYQVAMANLDAVLPPFADAISKYTGMIAVVTLMGPSAEEDGELIVRSVQSVTSKDRSRQTWVQADLDGYSAFQNSLLRYGQGYFTEAERRARAIQNPDSPADSVLASEDSAAIGTGQANGEKGADLSQVDDHLDLDGGFNDGQWTAEDNSNWEQFATTLPPFDLSLSLSTPIAEPSFALDFPAATDASDLFSFSPDPFFPLMPSQDPIEPTAPTFLASATHPIASLLPASSQPIMPVASPTPIVASTASPEAVPHLFQVAASQSVVPAVSPIPAVSNATPEGEVHLLQATASQSLMAASSQGAILEAQPVEVPASQPIITPSSQVRVLNDLDTNKVQAADTIGSEEGPKAPTKRGRTKRVKETESEVQDGDKTLADENGNVTRCKRARRLPAHLQEGQYEAPKKGMAPKRGSRSSAAKNRR